MYNSSRRPAFRVQNPCSTNNKNPVIDIAVHAEDQESKASKPLQSSSVYQGSDKLSDNPVLSVTKD